MTINTIYHHITTLQPKIEQEVQKHLKYTHNVNGQEIHIIIQASRICCILCDMQAYFCNNHNIKAFTLNIGDTQKIRLTGRRFLQFQSVNPFLVRLCHVTYHIHRSPIACMWSCCFIIHCILIDHQKLQSYCGYMSLLLFRHRQEQAMEHT